MRKWIMAVGLLMAGSLVASGPILADSNPAPQWSMAAGGNSGTLEGSATLGVGQVDSHALLLTGTPGSDVVVPKPVVDTTQSYTAMAWVKLNALQGYQTFLSIDGDQVSGFYLQLRGDSGNFAMTVQTTDNQNVIAGAMDPPVVGVWYHVAGVYDASSHMLSFYVNGVLQQTVLLNHPLQATGDTAIGRGKYGGNPVDWVNGEIDDACLYQTALTGAEIRAAAGPTLPPPPTPSFTINANQVTAHVSPTLYGLMTEEINHSYDGGLYAELIQNRIFKDNPNTPDHWSLVQDAGSAGAIALDTTQPINKALTTCLKMTVASVPSKGRVGVANDGYWGIPVMPKTRYQASFYAKSSDRFSGPLTVDIENSDGSVVYAQATARQITTDWHQYTVTLKTGDVTPSETNRFVVSAHSPGTVWLNLVSLFPPTYHKRSNGNRIDLMQMLGAMKPAFLRLPGGNYLEGNTIAERFAWKNTLGPLVDRPGHQGPWGYRSSDGMGLLEYLEWCQDLHMHPVLAVYAGYSLGGEHVDGGPQLTPFVQSALDEIQYVIGDPDTLWGAERVRDGHPAPFPLTYVEIGNEDMFDKSGSYDGRFAQFYDAIKAQYPHLQLIATTQVKTRTPDVYDEHYYRSPASFEGDTHHYDKYPRSGPKVFVGEWASQEGRLTPDLNSALGDAAWMTGMERNSDVVILESYAPMFVNVNPHASQWGTNLIGYDALHSYGSPSYYAQQMFGNLHGDLVVNATLHGVPGMYEDVTRDSHTGMVYVKVVNTLGQSQSIPITIEGVSSVAAEGQAIVLTSAHTEDTNTLTDPMKIVPMTTTVTSLGKNFVYTFAPYSVNILALRTKM
jgi:alpha-L-arabinofuranosidase